MDNSFIIPWLSSLNFQDTINNKASFMIFLINILNVQISIIASKSKLPYIHTYIYIYIYIYFIEFPWGFVTLNQTILLVSSFSPKKFLKFIFTHLVLIGWNSGSPLSLSKTRIQFLCKFIYFYFFMFINLGCS